MQRSFPVSPLELAPAPIPVVLYGLGAIGQAIARLALERRELRVVGAVDADPAKIGRDLGELLGQGPLGLSVQGDLAEARAAGARVALHSTQSFLPDVLPQLRSLIEAGISVVSSTEELSYPRLKYPEESRALDDLARTRDVRVLGTGVNPGFVMDTLPLLVTGLCQEASQVRIERVVDASHRRYNLQKKIGAGMTVAEFEAEMAKGRMGHVGLVESVAMVADGLGWQLERIDETLEPVVATDAVGSEFFQVPPGGVVGQRQSAIGIRDGQEAIALHLEMALGARDPHDGVVIAGRPELSVRVPGGVMGDWATAAVLVNAVPRLLEAPAGLRTMLDLPLMRMGH